MMRRFAVRGVCAPRTRIVYTAMTTTATQTINAPMAMTVKR
jgi:hypothetical protein